MERPQPTDETRTYRWQCPICETTRLAIYGRSDDFRALNALRTHIRSTASGGHGPVHELPADLDPDTLTRHVSRR